MHLNRRFPKMAAVATAGLAALLTACAGCCQAPPAETIVPVEQLVAEYNENAGRVMHFKAFATAAVTVYRSGVAVVRYGSLKDAPYGTILLGKNPESPLGPHDFAFYMMETTEKIYGAAVSSADRLYYFWSGFKDYGGLWFGRTDLAGAVGVADGMVIDPLQLMAVLCLTPLPQDLTTLPLVTQRMKFECPTAYVVTVVEPLPQGAPAIAKRELYFTWEAGKPRRVHQILFLDRLGRPVMKALLDDYQSVDMTDLEDPQAQSPLVPTQIDVTWFDPHTEQTQARLQMRLSKPQASYYGFADYVRINRLPPQGLLDKAVLIDADLAPLSAPTETEPRP